MNEREKQDIEFDYCVRDYLRCMYLNQSCIPDDKIDTTSNKSFFKKISTRLFKK